MITTTRINFDKLHGLIPVCVQDHETLQVLMIGFMNEEALLQTLETRFVTFYSRSKQRLWTKGESSGNYLTVVNMALDCDEDSLLILAKPAGPSCHTGDISCFNQDTVMPPVFWLAKLIQVIKNRQNAGKDSYTYQLITSGINRMAQKVGEEAVEVAIAAVVGNQEDIAGESVDLLYHLLVLLTAKQIPLQSLADIIQERMLKLKP
jgi:phosphoribosyl-ATP pyrophosphohydrolase/phosphoribosyl-AMP cyclohydrolase